MTQARLKILKTYKLYIGGKFPRTESGRTMTAQHAITGEHLAHYCHASRKDLRDAVVAAKAALPGWNASTPYLKGQILYRAAEIIEGRAASFSAEIANLTGVSTSTAAAEVTAAVDRLVYFAGWSDKYAQVFSSVNPVASPHFNFTFPEATGVVGILSPDDPSFLALVSLIAQVILSGNTTVAVASEVAPLPAITLGEALATSDIPAGVVNILSGKRTELAPWLAGHMDVNAIIDASEEKTTYPVLEAGTGDNLKRVYSHSLASPEDWYGDKATDPYRILHTVEFKTAWHPIGV